MEQQIVSEYRNLALASLIESPTNPRRLFDEVGLEELAASIRTQGVLSPLLVRPLTDESFEIVAGARRFRAAKLADAATVPVRIVSLTDAEALEAQLIENLQRRDVHPMEEAQGFRRLLDLEEPTYSIEQIAAKTGKQPVYVATRLKLIELATSVIEAFYRDEIGVGHALLLAKLPVEQQEPALSACFREDWSDHDSKKAKRILLPVRSLEFWIEQNVLLLIKEAPFDKRDAHLVAIAGSCVDCPKRTGHNKLLFADFGKQDACTDPTCYQSKVAAHIAETIEAKPQLVQISTGYGRQPEGSKVLARNQYTVIVKPKSKDDAKRREFKVCKFATEAIITDGHDVGKLYKVCPNPKCPVHHPKPQTNRDDVRWKSEQEKRKRDEAIAHATGSHVLAAISAAVPVRLMKRDLLFVSCHLSGLVTEGRLEALAKRHGIKRSKESEAIAKLWSAFLKRSDEGTLSRVLVEVTILLAASRSDATTVLKEAASAYKVDVEAIATKVKGEFAIKARARKEVKTAPKKKVAA